MTKEQLLQKIKEAKENNSTELDINYKRITELPPEISQLTNLQTLALSNNQLRTLPKEITQLSNLKTLYLSNNQLKELPPEITQLTNLQRLSLSGNQLRELPPEITRLTNLKELFLDNNQLRTLPKKINQLKNLQRFYLNNNQLSELPKEITQLTNLKTLDWHGNQLLTIPKEIIRLNNLQELYLNDNQLRELPLEITQLTSLHWLYLGNNQLSELPKEISQLTNLETLSLSGNPLPIPVEIIVDSQNPKKIIEYFSQYLKESHPFNEGKIILIGQGKVGKTSLREALIAEEGKCINEPDKTEGLEVVEWCPNIASKGNVKLNIWDFGGQEVYHATHQFFFKSGLYILVVDIDERVEWRTNRLEYWLKKIQTLSEKIERNEEADKTPVIIVGNKLDTNKSKRKLFDIKKLRAKYTKLEITPFVRIACRTGKNISRVKALIINRLEKIGVYEEFPATYLDAKSAVQAIGKNYISKAEFAGIVKDHVEQKLYVLERIGAITAFADSNKEELKDLIVIKPKWITEGIYKILSANHLLDENEGIVELREVKAVLDAKEYPRKDAIVEMMKEYNICFPQIRAKDDEPVLMFPSFFTVIKPPISGFKKNIVCFRYIFKILLDDIFPRFIVGLDKTIFKENLYWRSGIHIVKNEAKALIEVDHEENTLSIIVEAKTTNERLRLLSDIKSKFEEIIGGQEKDEKISVPQNPEIFVDYRNLVNLRKQSEKEFPVENLGRFDIDYLLHETDKNSINTEPIKLRFKENVEENSEINKRLKALLNTKNGCDKEVERNVRLLFITFDVIWILICVSSFLYFIYLLFFYAPIDNSDNWGRLEKFTFTIPTGITLIYFIVKRIYRISTNREFSLEEIREQVIKKRKPKKYLKYQLFVADIETLQRQSETNKKHKLGES